MKKISSKDIRAKRMAYAHVMEEVKPLTLLPELNVATLSMVADYFETDVSVVSGYYSTHKYELEEYGIIKLTPKDFRNAGYEIKNKTTASYFAEKDNVSVVITAAGARCMSAMAIYNMALGICKSEIADKIKAAAALAETEELSAKTENKSEESDTDHDNMMENMAENILTFTNTEFGSIRLVKVNSEPWFVGKDVADILGYTNSRKAMKDRVDDEDKGVTICDTLGGKQKITVINESGLYSLIMSSKLPSAKQFKKWVTSEVLPSIRKNGGYIAGQETMTDEELMARALLVAQKAIEDRDKKIADLSKSNQALVKEVNTWDKKSVLNALIRTYGARCFGGDFKNAYADFYRQFDYKFHTKLKSRKVNGKKNMSIIDCLTELEMDDALSLAAAICEGHGINVGAVINEVNAGAFAPA